MELMPLGRLGARETAPFVIDFGVFLPWVSAQNGNRLWVKIIHQHDQLLQDIQPLAVQLQHSVDPAYGDYWSGRVDITQHPKPTPTSAWGAPGQYVYRYYLENPNTREPLDWIIDPFAREFSIGKLSAVSVGYQDHNWDPEDTFQIPRIEDLIIYELMMGEFGGTVAGAIDKLDYLADLGINAIELMPVSNVALTVDWGYLPIGYFGVDERWGQRRDLQKFVAEAHRRGIAVIVDVVYGHTSVDFPYEELYRRLAYHENPFMGSFGERDWFGPNTDFGRKFTRDFFYSANYFWMDRFHVDGFRYDCVPNYWDGALGRGYANLVYHTYLAVKAQQAAGGHWQRFFGPEGDTRLIQCAEQLERPAEALTATYSNSTWQNGTYGAATEVSHGSREAMTSFGLNLGLSGYPDKVTVNGEHIVKRALQYIENHDHQRFVCNFRTLTRDSDPLFQEGDRSQWYRLQPYLIALLTAKGVPMLWQGQELGENYWIPDGGLGRVFVLRPVRWDYFYDPIGRALIWLVRALVRIRRQGAQFRGGSHYFHNHFDQYQSKRVLLFSRESAQAYSLVALNFDAVDQSVPFWFPYSGDYREELHAEDNLQGVVGGEQRWLTIPSNYGCIWTIAK